MGSFLLSGPVSQHLKQMSATLMLYQQYGFSSPDELDAAISAANTATQESLAGLKGLEAAIREKKELQRNHFGLYRHEARP